jgi:taspase (threonine aspartase 1)
MLLEQERKGLLSCGRIPPLMLCGSGAKEWGIQHGVTPSNSLITPHQLEIWKYFRSMIEKKEVKSEECGNLNSNRKRDTHPTSDDHNIPSKKPKLSTHMHNESKESDVSFRNVKHDTVGAICMCSFGGIKVAAGVSSGGLWMKIPSRVGEAAQYGAGCWAETHERDASNMSKVSVGCSVSGVGELILRDLTALKVSSLLLDEKLLTTSNSESQSHPVYQYLDQFVHAPNVKFCDKAERNVGLIALRVIENIPPNHSNGDILNHTMELIYGHTTSGMGIGWMSSHSPLQTIISKKDINQSVLFKSLYL